MSVGPDQVEAAPAIAAARRFAALSGSFEPQALITVLGGPTRDLMLAVTANLASVCDTNAASGGWLLRGAVRQREIKAWADDDGIDAAIAWRREFKTDPATDDLLDALSGSGNYSESAVRDRAGDAERKVLNRIATALERAGDLAPAHGALDLVRAALGRDDSRVRAAAMAGRGVVGRDEQLFQIADWLGHGTSSVPVQAVFISGLPGIGKSTLVDEAARQAATMTPPWIVVRLDFDRGGLDVQDRVGLTMEISRQVSNELGEQAVDLRQARLAAAGATPSSSPDVKGEGRERVPDELARALGDAVERAGRPVLMLIDTMELLRGRGETHPDRLFACLDELRDRKLRPMAVIAAGRGDAMDCVADRIGLAIPLAGLSAEAAGQLLESLSVEPTARAQIIDLAAGNPLILRLAAQIVRDGGAESLDVAENRNELAAAYLYRFLLSRIVDPRLQRLAEPGLIVRRINPDVIAEVLAPALDLDLAPGEAVRLFEELATHHWLVEPDSASGWVRHRSDIRGTLLQLLYGTGSKGKPARLDRAAAKWFASRPEPFAPLEAAYHQLQAMRTGSSTPDIDPYLLGQFDPETIAQLPQRAQDLIKMSRGERTSQWRGAAPTTSGHDAGVAVTELDTLLEKGDLVEASYVFARSLVGSHLDPRSHEAEVVRTLMWRTGQWNRATQGIAHNAFFRSTKWERLAERSPSAALAHVEMWAETQFRGLVAELSHNDALAGLVNDLRTRAIKGSLANGALGFAGLAAGVHRPSSSWSLDDPIAAADLLWHAEGGVVGFSATTVDPRAADALAMPASRFADLVSPWPGTSTAEQSTARPVRPPELSTYAGAARVLANSTPYNSVAEALRMADRDRFSRHLSGIDFDLAERGGLPPVGAGGWSIAPAVSPEGSIDNLAALGLLAEWLGAAALVARHSDLRRIARSAERFRRTTAGRWDYLSERPPGGRPWDLTRDATIDDRLGQLLDSESPLSSSEDQLQLWWGSGTASDRVPAADVVAQLRKRFPAATREAEEALRRVPVRIAAQRAATVMLRRRVPAAFVPPFAVHLAASRRSQPRRRS